MKLTSILLIIGICLANAATSYSQSTFLTIKMEDKTVGEVLDKIEENSEYLFLYNDKVLNVNRKVKIDAENQTIDKILDQLFEKTDNTYKIDDRQIYIGMKQAPAPLPQAQQQQKRTINGTVLDVLGEPVIGANILEKGTTNGIITDFNGRFALDVEPNATLVISYIGFVTQEVPVGTQTVVTVRLREDSQALDEVVVVGYGIQKKVNLTGAVDQVTSDAFDKRPITNISQGLVGVVPNLNINMSDNKPTQSPSYNIRGTTSIGQGGSALILIDGVEGNPSMLNPNDIESISVLKDAASSSIYGARAAFGVVLITTKSPTKGKVSVTYMTNLSSQRPTTVPDNITDSYPWAQHFSDAWARWNDNGNTPTAINKTMSFSPAYLEEVKRRWEDPSLPRVEVNPTTGAYEYYYSTDWYKELYKDSFFAQDHNLSVSGGSDIASFYLTGRYYGYDGLYRYNTDTYSAYNLRSKGIINITDWLQLDNNTEYSSRKYHQPYNVGEGSNIWRNIADEGPPLAPLLNPDGTLSFPAAYTIGDRYLGKSYADLNQRVIKSKTGLKGEFLNKSLTLQADFTFQNTEYNHQRVRVQVPYSRYEGVTSYAGANTNDLQDRKYTTEYLATNIYANYVKSFNERHNFNFLAGYNYEQSVYKNTETTRNGIVYEDAKDINLALGSNITTSGGYSKWRIAGGFFRVNYNFDERYLLEFNGRYDGSSKFPDDEQWAFFPSGSAGWRISQEPFWGVDESVLSNVKFRISYGSLGNGSINPYTFTENFSISQSARILNGARPQKSGQPNVIPNGLTWETATTGNLGLDITALSNRLSFTGDVYRRWTKDMYTVGPTVSAIFGATVPKGNYGSMRTTGWEITLNWMDQFQVAGKPFQYDVKFTLADYKSKITDFNNPEKYLSDYYEGQTVGEIWGYRVEGLFTSEADIANSPSQTNILARTTRRNYVGDLKFKDLNKDGEIYQGLNKADDSGDKVIIGNKEPRYIYGFTVGANWNGFFLSTFFQGVGKQDWYPSAEARFWGQYNRPYNAYPRWHENNMFRPELQNFDAYLPLLTGYQAQNTNGQLRLANDRYLQNVAYIRLKSLSFGYTIPKQITRKFGANELRVYVTGENLVTWSPLYKWTKDTEVTSVYGAGSQLTGFDHDTTVSSNIRTDGDGYGYPLLRTFAFGLSVTF